MTKQSLTHFAMPVAMLALALSTSPGLAQNKPSGPRDAGHQSSHQSQGGSRTTHAPQSGSPSYTFGFLDFPQAPNTAASGVNKKFEIVGAYGSSVPQGDGGIGFQLKVALGKNAETETYRSVNFPGEPAEQFANGLNDSGQIVGDYLDASGNSHGYELSGGTFSSFDYPGATGTNASAINNSGVIVGGWWPSSLLAQGFQLSGGTYTVINFPGSTQTFPYGINNSGDIVGFYDDASDVTHGFLLSGGTYTSIDVPGAVGTYATSINDVGEIVGGYCTTAQCMDDQNTIQGYLLSGGIFATLNVPGSTSTIIFGINKKGVIVGSYGTCGEGAGLAHGFFATP